MLKPLDKKILTFLLSKCLFIVLFLFDLLYSFALNVSLHEAAFDF